MKCEQWKIRHETKRFLHLVGIIPAPSTTRWTCDSAQKWVGLVLCYIYRWVGNLRSQFQFQNHVMATHSILFRRVSGKSSPPPSRTPRLKQRSRTTRKRRRTNRTLTSRSPQTASTSPRNWATTFICIAASTTFAGRRWVNQVQGVPRRLPKVPLFLPLTRPCLTV